jgi:putative membrane protein
VRRVNGTALVVVALLGTLDALPFPVWSYTGRAGPGPAGLAAGTVTTRWGPLTATDRDLIVRLRLAELWHLPAAQQARERSPGVAVKEAADRLIVGHTDLGRRVRVVALDLGVELPNRPTAQQRDRLRQLTGASEEDSDEDYEQAWANLLRSAHGTLFPAIGAVRNETRNSLVRQLASTAHQVVLDHITVLETCVCRSSEPQMLL